MNGRLRKRVAVASTLLLAAIALWLYFQRVTKIDLAARVPGTAIGYVEINDWPAAVDKLTSTSAWTELAPAFGLSDRWRYVGKVAWLIRATGMGPSEAVIASRSQFAVVVTSLEVRGDEVKPRVAFIAETHSSHSRLGELISARLRPMALKAFVEPVEERSEYAGVPVTIFRTADGARRILSAQIDGQWIIANDPEPMQSSIDTRLGRVGSMANNFYLQNSRASVAPRSEVFGFVSGDGVTRLTNFATTVIGGRLFGESPLGEALRTVFTGFSASASNGLAYGMSIERGRTVERYAWLCHPEVLDQVRTEIEASGEELRLPSIVPAGTDELTIISVRDPARAYSAIERLVSSRLGAAESFVFHRFLIGAREALLGLKEHESVASAFGAELGSVGLNSVPDERIWLIQVKDRPRLEDLARRLLTQGGARLIPERIGGADLWISSDQRRGAACFVQNFLALGSQQVLIQLLDAPAGGNKLAGSGMFTKSQRPKSSTPLVSFSSVGAETEELMRGLARVLPWSTPVAKANGFAERLPLATSETFFSDASIVRECYSPFGSLPFLLSIFERDGNGVAEK